MFYYYICQFSTELEISKHVKKHLTTKRYNHFSRFKICYFLRNKLIFKDYKFFKLHHLKWHFRDRFLFFNFLNISVKKRFYSFGLRSFSFFKNSFSFHFKTHLFKSLFFKQQTLLNRLDIVLWQSGFCFSLKLIRQLILHGFVSVNDRCITFCNYILNKGDVVSFFNKFDYYERSSVCKTKFISLLGDSSFQFFNNIMCCSYLNQYDLSTWYIESFDYFRRLRRRFLRNNVNFSFFLSFYSLFRSRFSLVFYPFFLKCIIIDFHYLKCLSFSVLKKLFNIFFKICCKFLWYKLKFKNIKAYHSHFHYRSLFRSSLNYFKMEFINVLSRDTSFCVDDLFSLLYKLIFFYWNDIEKIYSYLLFKRKLNILILDGCILSGRLNILKDDILLLENLNSVKDKKVPFIINNYEYHYSYAKNMFYPYSPYQNDYCYWIFFYSLLQNIYILKNKYELSSDSCILKNQMSFLNLDEIENLDDLLESSSFLKLFYSFSLFFKKYINIEVDYESFRFIFLDLSSNFLKNTMLMQNLIIVFLLRFCSK